jgi:hypothetical protein
MYFKLIPFVLSIPLLSLNFMPNLISSAPETPKVDIVVWQDLIPENDVILRQVINCESGGNENAIGKAGEIGILQFMPSTWRVWTEKMGKNLDINNPEHQIEVYNWAMKNGYAHSWTCFRQIFDVKW